MIVGNKESRETLTRYIDMVFSGDAKAPHFIIISGPKHIGKTSIVIDLLKQKMGHYFVTDVLWIKDFSEQLEKKHTLRIEFKPTSETSKILVKDHNYQDIGVREINKRLQQSAIGKHKVTFIENIERMTIEAANAFLKTCEEPLPKRLIIATTSNPTQLLETTISRALMIKFKELSSKELIERMDSKKMFTQSDELKQLVCNMAMGKPGIAQRIYDLTQEDEELQKILIDLIHNLATGKNILKTHESLKKIYKYGILEALIDGRIAYCINNDLQEKGQKRLATKRLMKININIENILLYGLLDI